MAINKKLIFWNTQSNFSPPTSASDTTHSVLWQSIVFFNDTKKIWTHGVYFSSPLDTALTAYSIGTDTALAASDTILGAFQKLQGQLNNKQTLDADLTAIAALTGTSGLLRKTAENTWSLDTTTYATSNHTHSSLSNSIYATLDLNALNFAGGFSARPILAGSSNIFPIVDNANAVLTVDMYDGSAAAAFQLGFSSSNNFYSRFGNGTWYKVWSELNFNPANYLGINAKAADSDLLDGRDSTGYIRTLQGNIADMNNAGNYLGNSTFYWATATVGAPTGYGVCLAISDNSTWYNQLAFSTDNEIYFRQVINDPNFTGQVWKKLYHSGNFNPANYSLTSHTHNQIFSSSNATTSALLVNNRTDDEAGSAWIYWDALGGSTSPWGIKHNQPDNYIEFYGNGNKRAYVDLNSGSGKILVGSDIGSSIASYSHTHSGVYEPADTTIFKHRGGGAVDLSIVINADGRYDIFAGTNVPNPASTYGTLLSFNGYYKLELYSSYDGTALLYRTTDHTNYTSWKNIYHSGNFTPANYLLLSGGTLLNSAILRIGDNDGQGYGVTRSRLFLAPPQHTGSEWQFDTYDDSSYAYLRIGYGGSNYWQIRNDGNISAPGFTENGTALASKYLQLSGGTLTGTTAIRNTSARATFRLNSVQDIPNDLYFANGDTDRWSITSRASNEGYQLSLYSVGFGYVTTFNYSNAFTTFNGGVRIAANNNLYLDNNFGQSIVGVYSANRYQGVYSMGDAYKLPIDGTGPGNLYGLAWSHPNAGGVAANLNTHGLLVMENGTFLAAVSGSIRARDDMRAPIFYDSNDTTYYLDPNSSGTSLKVYGNIDLYARSATWAEGIRIRVPSTATWGGIRFTRDRGNYDGNWALGFTGTDSTDDLTFWCNNGGSEGHRARLTKDAHFSAYGSVRAPIFYDSDDTGYYLDLNSTSNSALRIRGGALFGPNPSWGAYLRIGSNGNTDYSHASVVTTDGNLHMDPSSGHAMYLNYYVNGLIYLNGTSYYISSNGANYNGTAASAGYLTGGDSAAYMILYSSNSGDLNTYNLPGLYSSEYIGSTNIPSGYGVGHWIQISDAAGTDVKTQWYTSSNGDNIAMRLQWGNTAWKSWKTLIHNGNIGSQSVNYAASAGDAVKLKSSSAAGIVDLNTFLSGGGSWWNYGQGAIISNQPSWFQYGSVYQLNSASDSLALQIATTTLHNTTTPTYKIGWRMSNNLGFQNDWKEIIHSGNIGAQSVSYATNSSKLYSTDSQYAYGSGAPYYGYLTYNSGANRWRFKVSPATPDQVEVAYADSAGNADKLDNEHASAFAHIGAHNNLMASGNEFTFAASGFSGGLWINYRTAGGFTGNITEYYFGNGAGASLGTAIHSGNIGSQSVNYASSAGNSDTVDGQHFAWSNADNNPSYLWGANSNGSGFLVARGSMSVNYANYAGYANNLPTHYAGGQQTNPQVYFNNGIGLKEAMTGAWSVWSDTLWINGYSGGDVPWMCALHFLRNSEPRMAISAQTHTSTSYGTFYEVITAYNIASQSVSNADTVDGIHQYNLVQCMRYAGDPAYDTNSIGRSGYNPDSIFAYGKSGFVDVWGSGGTYPEGGHVQGFQTMHYSGGYGMQLLGSYGSDNIWVRQASGSSLRSWRKIWDSGNLTNLNQLTNGPGYITSSGSAAYASNSGALANFTYNQFAYRNGGTGYYQIDTWLQLNGVHGMYCPNTNNAHFLPNTNSSYGTWRFIGSRGGYSGIYDDYSGVTFGMLDSSGNGGFYREAQGRWYFYYHLSNTCLGINTSITSSSYGMYVSGGVYSTGNIVAYSDARKKENIMTVHNALETVLKMRGVFYNKIDDPTKKRQLGVIAQEMEVILPEVVTYASDIDEYGVAYGNLSGIFIQAFKEQQSLIDKQSEQINELKEMVQILTFKIL